LVPSAWFIVSAYTLRAPADQTETEKPFT